MLPCVALLSAVGRRRREGGGSRVYWGAPAAGRGGCDFYFIFILCRLFRFYFYTFSFVFVSFSLGNYF